MPGNREHIVSMQETKASTLFNESYSYSLRKTSHVIDESKQ